jgi:feruloyl esterase
MEAQRYPDDFDGVISGAPAAHWSTTGLSYLKNIQAAFPDPSYFDKPIVTQATLDLLSASVLEACDTLDGVKDGILDDPRECRFKLSSLKACANDRAGADCLTSAQRAAITAIYSPLVEGDRALYPGQPFGGENLPGGWRNWITGRDSAMMRTFHVPNTQAMFLTEGLKYIVYADTTWDYSHASGNTVLKDSHRLATIADAEDPNLVKFAARKGKLILWHGWSDPALNPLATIDYYGKVLATDPHAREYVRLFMEPGVLHCTGGNGPSTVAWLRLMTDWVERSQAPEQVVATKRDSTGKVTRSRPLCAYPQRAVYKGEGSTDDASNFVCREGK